LCWGNASFAFATRLTQSFALYRWCPNIIGPRSGGAIMDLPVAAEAPGSMEVSFTERREFELSEAGFIPLKGLPESGGACFFSARSLQKPKYFGESEEGRAAEMNYRLGTELPYLFITTRVMHYLKMTYRSGLETWDADMKDMRGAEKELNDWVGQYVADRTVVTAAVRGRRPLRKARVIIHNSQNEEAWYELDFQVRPHFKYMGAFFTLSLNARLDKP